MAPGPRSEGLVWFPPNGPGFLPGAQCLAVQPKGPGTLPGTPRRAGDPSGPGTLPGSSAGAPFKYGIELGSTYVRNPPAPGSPSYGLEILQHYPPVDVLAVVRAADQASSLMHLKAQLTTINDRLADIGNCRFSCDRRIEQMRNLVSAAPKRNESVQYVAYIENLLSRDELILVQILKVTDKLLRIQAELTARVVLRSEQSA